MIAYRREYTLVKINEENHVILRVNIYLIYRLSLQFVIREHITYVILLLDEWIWAMDLCYPKNSNQVHR